MIRYLFVFVMLVHGLIHLMGFAKAFGYGKVGQITGEISKPAGVLWLITSILFIITIVMVIQKNEYWIWTAIIAAVISQVLILAVWKDAKFGTIGNLIIVIAAIAVITGRNLNFVFRD